MKTNDLLQEITNLMISHQEEIKFLKDSFSNDKKVIEKEIARLKSNDVDFQLSDNYTKMADVLEKIIDDLEKVQASFPLDDYAANEKKQLSSIKPRIKYNLKNNTADWASLIQTETIDIINKLEKCTTYDEMTEQLKRLYQEYVDAKYIKNNVVELLKSSKLYDQEVSRLLSVQEKKLDELTNEYNYNTKLENLSIYPTMTKLKNELADIRATQKDYRIKNGDIEFGNGYNDSFLFGIHQDKDVSKELVSYAKKYLNDDLHSFNDERLYWKLDNNHSSLIFDLPSKIMAERSASKFFDYIEQLLFTFITGLPVRKVKLAGIDCPAPNNQSISSPFVPILQRAEKFLGTNIMYSPIVRDKNKVSELIDSLFAEGQNRSDTYFSEGYENIYNYNKATMDNQHDFKILLINNYPYGFDNEEIVSKLQSLIKNSDTGIITIIFQSNDKSVYEIKRSSYGDEPLYTYLDYKELNVTYLTNFDFTDKTFTMDGVRGSFELESPEFDHLKYWEDINRGYQNANILYIDALLNQVDQSVARGSAKYSAYDHKLRIPIGKANGDIYDFTINVKDDSSAIILGTTGSGKSSLLHTLVFSAANMYSPSELNICLVDFKGADASTEFSLYQKGKELYLPHVNYLSLKSTTENALDMLDMLETIQNERMKIFNKNNVPNIVEYNNLPSVRNNKNKIIPRMLFIIDEFNTMLAGGAAKTGDSSINDVIETRIFSLLTRVRSAGITIIFSGHTTEGLNERHMKQIKIRVGLRGFVGRLFEVKYDDSDLNVNNILNEKGKSIISTDIGETKTVVGLAYSGEMGSSRQLALAEKIRNKYASLGNNFKQIVAGSTELVPISEMTDLKTTIIDDENLDKYSYPAYIGVASTSSIPVAVRFSSEQSLMNYLMTGESSHLAIFERNIVLGFAYMLKVRKMVGNQKNISYVRISDGIKDNNNEISTYLKYKLINKVLSVVDDKYEACREILKIYDIYQSRVKRQNNDITPYLLLVHNVGWIKDDTWMENSEPNSNITVENDFSSDIMNMDTDALLSSLASDSIVDKSTSYNDTESTSNNDIDLRQVEKALEVLYTKGYIHNIFVVLASPISSELDEYVTAANRGNTSLNYSISDSFDFYSTTKKYPSSCCHINSTKLEYDEGSNMVNTKFVSSKTRLFNYSEKTEKAFLKEFDEVK